MKPRFAANRYLAMMSGGLLAAMLSASCLALLFNTPLETLLILVGLMLATGSISLAVGYTLYQRRAIRLLHSLHLSLMVNTVMTITILFVNISAIAWSMFIDENDSILVTSLLVFAAVLAVIFGLLHSRLLTHELRELANAADKLGEDIDLSARLPLFGNDELASLVVSFNKMAERLQAAEQQKRAAEQLRRDLVAWVSHDLRTPLTSLRAMNEALIDGVVSDAEQSALYLRDMNCEIVALSALIDDMFELSLLDTGQSTLHLQKASLRDVLSAMVGGLSARAALHQIDFQIEIRDKDIDPVFIDPDKIQRVLQNLADNAFQHVTTGGRVCISARCEGASIVVAVFNSDSVIPAGDLPHIFDQFYRGDKARRATDHDHRHAGLGLAIAKRFVEAHGGKIWAESHAETGTTVFFSLPHARSAYTQRASPL